jgi:hypothetical protein
MPKSSIVVNVFDGKPKNFIRWERKPDGELSWKYIKKPKQLGSNAGLEVIKKFYTAIGVPTYVYDLNKRMFVG